LHLVDGHQARIEQNGGNRVAQQMRVDALTMPACRAKRSTIREKIAPLTMKTFGDHFILDTKTAEPIEMLHFP
jgi:hypothetical protein